MWVKFMWWMDERYVVCDYSLSRLVIGEIFGHNRLRF